MLLSWSVGVQALPPLPQHDAPEPSPQAVVEQNEYRIWKEHDRHARAYESLKSERAKLIARRMDLGEPSEASLCLSCYQGTPGKPANQRLYSAGHPRLALDTFTMARPAHHIEDHDYELRKPDLGALRVWTVGQVLAAKGWRELHADAQVNPEGAWPAALGEL